MAAAPGGIRLWFRLEGAASADRVVLPPGADVADLRDKIKEKLAGQLQVKFGRTVDASELVLSTADGKTTYSRASQPVSTIDATTGGTALPLFGHW
jgi:hypothetical protein